MNNPPKLIREFLSKEWFSQLYLNFVLQEEFGINKVQTDQYPNQWKIADQQFETFKAEEILVYNSYYFKSFIVEMKTQNIKVFEHVKKYCTNSTYTSQNSWSYSGSRMTNYEYVDDKFLTNLIITKQSDQFVGIRLERTTIEKSPKNIIETKLDLKGEIHLCQKVQTQFDDYSQYSNLELKSIKSWKNIDVAKRRQVIRAKMSIWIENLFKCDIGDPQTQKVRSFYLNEEQREEIRSVVDKSDNSSIRIKGEFKMHDDSSAILIKIDHLEPWKH